MALKITSKTKIATSSCDDYIEYWNIVIEQWLQNLFGCKELKQQKEFASDLGFDVDSISNRLPEPYWGDPDNCSFVIMGYNPGPCHDSRHNYRFCADTVNCMIHAIKLTKYSDFAKSFPLYRDLASTELWLEDSIGRDWWQKQKTKWIQNLLKELHSIGLLKNEKFPFVMELCAWHSVNWPGVNKREFSKYRNYIKDTILIPLEDAIKKSDLHIGLCFGKRIGTEFLDRFVQPNELISVAKELNYNMYSFDEYYHIINYWDDINHRNRYPQNAKDIMDILRKHGII